MTGIDPERWYAGISDAAATMAGLIDGADLTRRVPTCPDWTVRQLATHVGRAQRWAAEIVATRSAVAIPFREVPDGRFPDDPARHADWLRDGAARLTGAIRATPDEQVWAFGAQRPAILWARRMAHETAVHRADAEIAFGREPGLAADLAADGIDEWLGFQIYPDDADQQARLDALAEGQMLHLHATDDGLGTAGEWLIRRTPDGIAISHGHGKGDVAVRGPASALLFVLVRRLPPDHPSVQVIGDRELLDRWLAATPF